MKILMNLIPTSPFLMSPADSPAGEGAPAAPAVAGTPPAAEPSTETSKAAEKPLEKGKVTGEVKEEKEDTSSIKSLFGEPGDDAFFELEDEDFGEPKAPKEGTEKAPAAQPTEVAKPAAEEPPKAAPTAKPAEGAPAGEPPPAATEPAQGTVEKPAEAAQPSIDKPAESSFLEAIEANRDKILPELEKMYHIEEKDLEEFAVNPAPILKKLAATLHLNVIKASTALMMQQIPALVLQTTDFAQRRTTAENKFFEDWPQLDRKADLPLINQYSQMFWQANPKASFEDFSKTVGTMVAAQTGKLQAAPAAKPNGQAKPKGPAFTPAGSGAPRAPAAKPADDDTWGNIARNLDNEE